MGTNEEEKETEEGASDRLKSTETTRVINQECALPEEYKDSIRAGLLISQDIDYSTLISPSHVHLTKI
ncbi:MAG: hypothetical protein U9Q06_03360 [Nanoarchaeota archaeon]|nr:hypothetical protein [Nanoarchaeota archaeon]